jgi:hypothetical protein
VNNDEKSRLQASLRAVPKGIYCELSGRQHKVVSDCQARYGLPVLGETVDLFVVVRWFHDLLAKRGDWLVIESADIEALEKEKLRLQTEKLRIEAERLKISLLGDQKRTIERDEVREKLGWLVTELRQCGVLIGRANTGRDGQAILNDLLDRMAEELRRGVLTV